MWAASCRRASMNQNALQAAPHEAMPPGSGVLIGVSDASAALSGLAAELKKIADSHNVQNPVGYRRAARDDSLRESDAVARTFRASRPLPAFIP